MPTVSSKLSLPSSPPDGTASRPWTFRRTDLDQFAHVNNAAVWTAVEEVVQVEGVGRSGLTAEIEYLAPAAAGVEMQLERAGAHTWLTVEGKSVIAARVAAPGTAPGPADG